MTYKEKQEVRKDQAILEHLVSKYGKDDVLQFINEGLGDFVKKIGKGIASGFTNMRDKIVDMVKSYIAGRFPYGVSVIFSDDAALAAGESEAGEAGRSEIQAMIDKDVKDTEAFWDNYIKTANVSESYVAKLHRKWSKLNEAHATPESDFIHLETNEETHVDDVNTKELKRELMFRLRKRMKLGDAAGKDDVLLIWGAPGIGKTAIVNQLILDLQQEAKKKMTLIDTRLASMDYDDFFLPAANRDDRGKARERADIPASWLPVYRLGDESGNDTANAHQGSEFGGVLFFDELSRANHGVMNVLMKLVDERQLGEYRLGDRWSMIAAANRESDMADDSDFTWEAAFGRRFSQVNFVPTREEWLNWAKNEGHVRSDIIEFIESYPDHWYEAIKSEGATATGATPASWTQLSQKWDDMEQFDPEWDQLDDEEKNERKLKALKAKMGKGIFRKDKKGVEYDMDDYLNVFKNFPKSKCAAVWKDAKNVDPTFVQTPGNISQVVKAIFISRPKPQDKVPSLDQFDNFMQFVIKLDDPSKRAMAYENMLSLIRREVDSAFLPNMATLPGGKPNPYNEVARKYTTQLGKGHELKGARI